MKLLHEAADLLLGARCPGCGRARLGLCEDCRSMLTPSPCVVVRRAPAELAPMPTVAAIAGLPYARPVRGMISAFKDHHALMLRPTLAQLLAFSIQALIQLREDDLGAQVNCVGVVPLPSHPESVRRRGFDHAGSLSQSACRTLVGESIPVEHRRLLSRQRKVSDQAGLTRAERWRNQLNTMRAQQGSGAVIVVDDVITTGASLSEAARALTAAGWWVVGSAVIAHTIRTIPAVSARHYGREGNVSLWSECSDALTE